MHTHTQTDNPQTSIFIAHFLSWWIAPHAAVSMFFNKGATWLQLNQLNFWTIFQIGTKDLGLGSSSFNEKNNEKYFKCRESSLAPKAWILAICLLIPGALEKRYEAVGKTTGNHFLFFGEVKASLSLGVLKLWLEVGIRIPKQLPCLGNEQGNVPEKVMNLTSAPFVSASCHRCRRRGVGGCGIWMILGRCPSVLSPNVEKCYQVGHFTTPSPTLVTFWRICRPNCMIWAGRCGNLIEFLGRWHGCAGSRSGCLQSWGSFWYSKLIRNGTFLSLIRHERSFLSLGQFSSHLSHSIEFIHNARWRQGVWQCMHSVPLTLKDLSCLRQEPKGCAVLKDTGKGTPGCGHF